MIVPARSRRFGGKPSIPGFEQGVWRDNLAIRPQVDCRADNLAPDLDDEALRARLYPTTARDSGDVQPDRVIAPNKFFRSDTVLARTGLPGRRFGQAEKKDPRL